MNNQQIPSPIENSKPICCGKSICDIQVGYVDGRLTQRFRPTKQVQQKLEDVFNQLLEQGYEWLEAYTEAEEVFVRGLGSDSVAKVRNKNDLLVNAQNFWQILSGKETGLETPEIRSADIKDAMLTTLKRIHLALSVADKVGTEPTEEQIQSSVDFLQGSYHELSDQEALKRWITEHRFTNQEDIRESMVRALRPIIFNFFDILEELKTHREAVSDESSERASTKRKILPEIISLVDEAIKSQLTRDQIKNLMDALYRRLSDDHDAYIGEESKDDTIRKRSAILSMKPLNSTVKNNTASKPMYEELQTKINAGHFDTI
ncbi:MAG: hypothetical protein M1579_05685 [Gammaproteobacteria bacterium]|nr:hypothetical protein [Gammaproteobacteria bacterium]